MRVGRRRDPGDDGEVSRLYLRGAKRMADRTLQGRQTEVIHASDEYSTGGKAGTCFHECNMGSTTSLWP